MGLSMDDSGGGKSDKAPSPPPYALEPPPRAFLTSGSLAIPVLVTQSPWAADDDTDAFGDWAAAEPATSSAGGWSGWVEERVMALELVVGTAPPPASSRPLTPRLEGFGGASPIAWPGNTATAASPGLGKLSRSSSAVLVHQPSPDPLGSGVRPASVARVRPGLAHGLTARNRRL